MTERTKAILLFTSYFAKEMDKEHKPLSLAEWNKFVRWLQTKNLNPEDFLVTHAASLLVEWNDQQISKSRLLALLERKTALAIALEKWTRAGVWIISRGDTMYPKKLKEKLKALAPNIIFGVGNQELLNERYIGVIGSRNVEESDLNLAKSIGNNVSQQQIGVVSGSAKGVDEAAMLGSLEKGGTCIGVLADSLIKKSTSLEYRKYIIDNKLVLVSPYNPEAGFNAGNAMSRNKLIYAMSELAIVVKSDTKGGTWEGAKENLKNKWVPLWVCASPEKGNQEIVKLGGKWLPQNNELKITDLIHSTHQKEDFTLFSATEPKIENTSYTEGVDASILNKGLVSNSIAQEETNEVVQIKLNELDFFHLFIVLWFNYFKNKPVAKTEIIETMHLTSKQVDVWIEMALKEETVEEKSDSNGYVWRLSKAIQLIP